MEDDHDGARAPNGRWPKGVSGNRNGRPKNNKQPVPRSFADALAVAMLEKIEIVDASGKRKRVTPYQAAARQLVRAIPELKPKELILAMGWMEKLRVFDAIYAQAGGPEQELTIEQTREQVKGLLENFFKENGCPEQWSK